MTNNDLQLQLNALKNPGHQIEVLLQRILGRDYMFNEILPTSAQYSNWMYYGSCVKLTTMVAVTVRPDKQGVVSIKLRRKTSCLLQTKLQLEPKCVQDKNSRDKVVKKKSIGRYVILHCLFHPD